MRIYSAEDILIAAIETIGTNPDPEKQETKRQIQGTLRAMKTKSALEAKGPRQHD